MKSFKRFLNEATPNAVVVTFGRFNPITSGHEKLAEKLRDEAKKRKATGILYASQSQDPKKNPLKFTDKVKLLKKAFPYLEVSTDKSLKNLFQIAEQLSKDGVKEFTLVVGSDRVAEFKKGLGRYVKNDKTSFSLDFDKFEVVSAGERDESDSVSGMSASKMRALVQEGDQEAFKKGLPKKLEKDYINILKLVQKGMGL